MRLSLCLCVLLLSSAQSARGQNTEAPPSPAPSATRAPAPTRHVQIVEHATDSDHPSLGPKDAPVTIEFFVNIASTLSGRMHRDLLELAENHPRRLRVVYRLTESREQSRSEAQTFAREAFEQGRFFEFMRAYYGERQRPPSPKDYPEVAAQAGLNYERVQDAMEWMRHDEALAANHFYARRLRVSNFPALVINGRSVPSGAGPGTLEDYYDTALAETFDLQASGLSSEQIRRYQRRERIAREPRPSFTGPVDGVQSGAEPRAAEPINMAPLLVGGHRKGSDVAPVALVFFCHLQSVLCQTMSRELEDVLKAYPDRVQLVFHALWDEELPLKDKARFMHEALLCAEEQDAFWEYYRHAFDHQSRIGFDLSLAVELAGSPALDLNAEQFEACLETGRTSERVTSDLALARKAGVAYTPALAIGGMLYPGRMHFSDIRYLVEQELRAGIFETWASSP